MPNNPYIPIVEKDPDIISNLEDIYSKKWKWSKYFWNNNDIYLEIWTGLGNFFSRETFENPDINYIWMEIKFKRLFKSAEKSRSLWSKNFVLIKDFWQNIDKIFQKEEIKQTYIFFPDPWWNKNRQKKHRLFQKDFIEKLYFITKKWWKVIFKTDHLEYFNTTLDLFKDFWKWETLNLSYDYEKETDKFDSKKLTEFEAIFRKDRLKINYVEFIKK